MPVGSSLSHRSREQQVLVCQARSRPAGSDSARPRLHLDGERGAAHSLAGVTLCGAHTPALPSPSLRTALLLRARAQHGRGSPPGHRPDVHTCAAKSVCDRRASSTGGEEACACPLALALSPRPPMERREAQSSAGASGAEVAFQGGKGTAQAQEGTGFAGGSLAACPPLWS